MNAMLAVHTITLVFWTKAQVQTSLLFTRMDIITDEIISILFMYGIHTSSCREQDYMMTALIVFAEAQPQIGEGKGRASTNTLGNLLSPSSPLPPVSLYLY